MGSTTLARPGESWSGYTVLETLGRMGMAELYRVRAPDGRSQLLQVIAIRHPELVERLRDAGLHRVSHPNVLSVTDVIPVLRFPGLVSVDVVGMPLPQWAALRPSLRDRLDVFRGIAEGTAALHAAGVVHGGLQPDVVLVEVRRGRPTGWVTLPGVASVVFAIIREGGAVSSSGASLGERAFQAPEQQRSPSDADLRSDVFQLGCLLYYLLAGRSPFSGLDLMACYDAARTETWAPPPASPDLAELVRDMLRADPADRPPMREVVDRLDPMIPAETVRYSVPAALGFATGAVLVAAAAWWVLS